MQLLSVVVQNSFPGLAHYSKSLCRERNIRHRRVKMECLQAGRQCVVYLITYGRADVVKFPSKESFSNAVLQAWQGFVVRVVQWITCIEAHHNTDNAKTGWEMSLYHYRMAFKLEKRVRWFQVRKYLDKNFGIKVDVSDNHTTYYSAYRYVTKKERSFALALPSRFNGRSSSNRICCSHEKEESEGQAKAP